ncbi:MAG: RNB domain-containing ribonuclease [Gemmatimonadetes bacterium]|nr:RNB domain-containing ribonuclease [Gemmatimonadota bacterium]
MRIEFPHEVLREAEEAAKRDPAALADLTEIPFITIDPPGSRDLDQALCIQPADDGGFRLWYAIADVGFFVDRGGAVEREAWLRGLTFYAPDLRAPVYPPSLSQGAASLLADQLTPAIVVAFELDARAEIASLKIQRARVKSRAQLTYEQALAHVESGGKSLAEPWAASLMELRRFGEERRKRETERGGVSLPILEQHVQRTAAASLGYEVEYERPNVAEDWNAQVSLLTGHAAALRMVEGRVGLLRTMPPPEPKRVEVFRRVARTLGFAWDDGTSYAEFVRSLDPRRPNVAALLWQARRVSRGSDYVAFDGDPPADPLHHALAMPYAHVTAPLRRLADRYILDLLVELDAGRRPSPEEVATLLELPAVMNDTETRANKLERGVVDIAEAWTLHGREGERFGATVLDVREHRVEVQIEDPAVRVQASSTGPAPELGARVEVRLDAVSLEEGQLDFTLAG